MQNKSKKQKLIRLLKPIVESIIKEGYGTKSYQLTKQEYNYLLPIFGLSSGKSKLGSRHGRYGDEYYIIANGLSDIEDILSRLQGVYDSFEEDLPSSISRATLNDGDFNAFRSHMRTKTLPNRNV